MSSAVGFFNDSRAGTALYLSPVPLPHLADEWEASAERKKGRKSHNLALTDLKMSFLCV